MRNILIVDDNLAFAENLAEILEDFGIEAVTRERGDDALKLIAASRGPGNRRFDALVTDMRMPVMSGARLVNEVRHIDPGLPVVLVTAHTSDGELRAALREGVLAVLPKPLPITQTVELLRDARRDGFVVLVEDDVALSENLAEILRQRGYCAVCASTLLDVEHFGGVVPFAAVVDLRVPGGPDGEAMHRIAARFPGLPMLVVSGFAEVGAPLPPHERFLKPIDSAGLLLSIDALYAGRPGPHREAA